MVFTNEIANSNSRKLWFGALWMLLGTLFICGYFSIDVADQFVGHGRVFSFILGALMCFGGNIILFKNGLEHSRWGMVCFALYPAPLFTFLFYEILLNIAATVSSDAAGGMIMGILFSPLLFAGYYITIKGLRNLVAILSGKMPEPIFTDPAFPNAVHK